MRKLGAVCAAAFLVTLLAGAVPGFASGTPTAVPSAEQDFLSKINHERTSRGLRALSWDAHLGSVARNHSEEMARRGELYHNSNLPNEVSGWKTLGENVGEGPDVQSIHDAFMDSPEHRDNVLGPYTMIGVGVVRLDGEDWVTEVFEMPASSTSSSSGATVRHRARATSTAPTRVESRAAATPRWHAALSSQVRRVSLPVRGAPVDAMRGALALSMLEHLTGEYSPATPEAPARASGCHHDPLGC